MRSQLQRRILAVMASAIANGLFVDLPRKSRAIEAAATVKNPRTITVALVDDFDALGSHVSGIARGVAS